jgi:hypothetical protein
MLRSKLWTIPLKLSIKRKSTSYMHTYHQSAAMEIEEKIPYDSNDHYLC